MAGNCYCSLWLDLNKFSENAADIACNYYQTRTSFKFSGSHFLPLLSTTLFCFFGLSRAVNLNASKFFLVVCFYKKKTYGCND